MKRIILALGALCLASTAALAAPAGQDVGAESAWVQFVPGGGAEIRAIATGGCPGVTFGEINTTAAPLPTPMVQRAPADAKFHLVCSLAVPQGATVANIVIQHRGWVRLAMPVADPQRILVLGDTGCRIKGALIQACNDPKQWPFARLAKAAAAMKPDLIIHLGDYLYRETPCPDGDARCAGSPYGDNYDAWAADFFTPAAPLLTAAPWIVIRGNHEDCFRAGPGFLRMLGPTAFDPAAPCNAHLDPYAVMAGSQTIAILDSASASDQTADQASVPLYAKDFETLKAMANVGPGRELWLATHRPIWAAITYLGAPAGGNATMITAAGDLSVFNAISLMLAGHIHAFEAINYDARLPPQIVAGHGGDLLDSTPADLRGTTFDVDVGIHVKNGFSIGGFGFLLMTREKGNDGWTIQLFDSDGNQIRQCAYAGRAVFCLDPK